MLQCRANMLDIGCEVMHTDAKGCWLKGTSLELQAYEHRADLGGTREHGVPVIAIKVGVLRKLCQLCHRQIEPFCVPRRVAVMQQPCCSVVHMTLTWLKGTHWSFRQKWYWSTERIYGGFNQLNNGLQTAVGATHPRLIPAVLG